MGLHRAGYDVIGVDIEPQPNYPFEFYQADALDFYIADADLVWASPPCQAHSSLRSLTGKTYEDFIGRTRAKLIAAGIPYIIENVVGAPLLDPVVLCGSSFGLGVWRHRQFETSFPVPALQCNHPAVPAPVDVTGTGGPATKVRTSGGGIHRKPRNLTHAREVMQIDWMSRRELSQAVPPAYSQYLAQFSPALM